MKKELVTTTLLISAGCGLTGMFVSILPEGATASEPNKLILWGEIIMSLFFVGWGIYAMVRVIRRSK